MKNLILALGLTMASSVALAQPPAGMEGRQKGQSPARMQQELGLTDEQVQQMREIRESGGSSDDVRAVLTPEQQAKAAELRKGNRGERAGRLKEELNLSDEQVSEMQQIRESGGSREEIRGVLSPEQQAQFDEMRRGDREGQGARERKGQR